MKLAQAMDGKGDEKWLRSAASAKDIDLQIQSTRGVDEAMQVMKYFIAIVLAAFAVQVSAQVIRPEVSSH